jgi:shikimate kinase
METTMSSQQTATATATMPLAHLRRTPRPTRPAERIVLTGFMGSGKSTVGPLLAAELGWKFVDLDLLIELRTGHTVPHIFAERGEEAFRKEETAALVAALGHSRTVIALGGGAPETLGNRLLLEQTPATAVVYLAAPFDTLSTRCAAQAETPGTTLRPVFNDPIAAHMRFEARQPLYRRLAHATIETEGLTPTGSVAAILATVATKTSRT